jgi:hypothetical protein
MKYLLILMYYSIQAKATANFHCYSVPNMPVQTYEYGSSNCSECTNKKTSKNKTNIGEDGTRDVLCMYTAGCMPVTEEQAKKEPQARTINEVSNLFASKFLKTSILVCKGTGTITNGDITDAHCPTASQCRKDVFYNFVARSFSSGVTEPSVINGKSEVNSK